MVDCYGKKVIVLFTFITSNEGVVTFFSWLILYIRMNQYAKECVQKNYSVPQTFYNLVKRHPNKVAFHYKNEAWTYKMVETFSNKIANYFKNERYNKGDTIALLLENCAEYPAIWLGLSKSGIVTALINTNLVEESLMHCIKAANCKALIFGSSHSKVVSSIMKNMELAKLYQFCPNQDEEHEALLESVNLNHALQSVPENIQQPQKVDYNDPVLYIYTSGTTGLPKAALLSHARLMLAVKSYSKVAKMTPNDIIYTTIPLYHSAGGIVGIGQALLTGITVVVQKKFSASNYFSDCAKYNATIGQYVGELCRYLLANPDIGSEKHQLRVLLGNGLKPQIWQEFIGRFKIKQVIEFYGATEGIANMSNNDGTIGAVGFIPRYLKWAFPITNIKCDEATGKPLRSRNGLCIECNVGEPGLLIAKINISNPLFKFEGYTDDGASEKRILHNVFQNGDVYFNSGDILSYDEYGYFYFKDRSGDTFRWKSENVSTSEVEAVIGRIVHLNDVSVYGVQVPFNEGKAGMAAIVDPSGSLNIGTFGETLNRSLPSYAIPIFLRIMDLIPITGTFKMMKTELRKAGFNINTINDQLYFYDSQYTQYVPLTKEIYKQIEAGTIKI